MPYPIFQVDATNLPEVGLPAIDTLAARYSTSLTSTAIRYTRLSQHVCAIVSAENGRVKYFAYSERVSRKLRLLSRQKPTTSL